MRGLSALRFFKVALRPARALAAGALLIGGLGAWTRWTDQHDIEQVTVLAIFFLMFAAATGYREQAVRGRLDPILVATPSRLAVAGAHFAVSLAPGAVAWMLLGCVVLLIRPEEWPGPFSASGLVAFLYVSSVAWAFALPTTRYASGVVWVGTLVTFAAGHQMQALREAFLMAGSGWTDGLKLAGAALACPIFLLADPFRAGPEPLLFILLCTAAAVAAGAWYIARLDMPLRDLA